LLLLKPVIPVMGYIINYDYIIKELCENKAKPELKCNGKCHLMSELAKASENEKPISTKKTGSTETEILFFQEFPPVSFPSGIRILAPDKLPGYSNLYSFLPHFVSFRPPSYIS
jgi:hypothetical protein